MADWAAKRFWSETTVVSRDTGFSVELDGRQIKTPTKTPLVVPTKALAQALATEWEAQEGKIDPTTMPMTRTANSAIDKVATQFAEVAEMLAAYGDSDLLCYRATSPESLIRLQAENWDPLLDWAAESLSARLVPVEGIVHKPQDPVALRHLSDRVHAFTPFELAAFHDLVAISGSLILGFGVSQGHLDPQAAWTLSRIDEDWQRAQWGADEEADQMAELKRTAFQDAADFLRLCNSDA